jgi:deoxycytidine triphosphate deaminase
VTPRTEGLRRSLLFRLAALDETVRTIRSQRTPGRAGIRQAVDIIAKYPAWVRRFVNTSVRRVTDEDALLNLLGLIAEDVVLKTNFIEEWFAEGSSTQVPLALAEAVERECVAAGIGKRLAVLAIGQADNFGSLPLDLVDYLFVQSHIQQRKPTGSPRQRFALVQVPRLEGGEGLWWPIVVGHEVAHIIAAERKSVASLGLARKIDWNAYKIPANRRTGFLEVAESWATELLCDAYAAYRFGPAGAAAVVELLDLLGATSIVGPTHPPGWLRFRLLRHWVGDLAGLAAAPVMAQCEQICALPSPIGSADFRTLATFLEGLADEFLATVATWHTARYVGADRDAVTRRAIEDLEHGIPPRAEFAETAGATLTEADVINAGWIQWLADADWPVSRLVSKSLDNLAFLRHWKDGGGTTGTPVIGGGSVAADATSGVLSGKMIIERTGRTWADRDPLVITPVLPKSVGEGSVDVRLGPQFIVLQRTDTPSIRTFDPSWDAREIQRRVEVGWGERFVLHPNELVLASTLEYVSLPSDLSAQVVTRSSYGRLGLITATAVQVHPYFHGCLTLELLNLGLVPLELMPGERIAQLVFMRVTPPAPAPRTPNLDCPIGPEFSRPPRPSEETKVFEAIISEAQARKHGQS